MCVCVLSFIFVFHCCIKLAINFIFSKSVSLFASNFPVYIWTPEFLHFIFSLDSVKKKE